MKWLRIGKARQVEMSCLLRRLDQMELCIKHVRQRIQEGKEVSGLTFWRIQMTAGELDMRANRLRETHHCSYDSTGEDVPGYLESTKPEKIL